MIETLIRSPEIGSCSARGRAAGLDSAHRAKAWSDNGLELDSQQCKRIEYSFESGERRHWMTNWGALPTSAAGALENGHDPAGTSGDVMKKIGLLSFGHWSPSTQSQTRAASDILLQSIDLAVAAEELGADGAYFRVHHFARQLASPFPLLAAVGAKTRRIEIGTGVIDMRYENPFYMVEDAGAADLISGGRLQLGISRGSPEQVIEGWRHFGFQPRDGESDAEMGRRHGETFLELLRGEGFAEPNPRPMFPNPPGLLRLEPHSDGLRDRIWWGAASDATAVWAAQRGMNLQSSTLKVDESGEPFHIQQAAQIRAYRAAWREAGHRREPRISVSRSIFPIMNDMDRAYFGRSGQDGDSIGNIEPETRAVFGRTYAAEPHVLVEQLRQDQAIAEADTLLLTIPNQLGVAYCAHVIEAMLKHVAPALGWRS
ncbi:alkanesulfonate monooxygenase SsuD/methylene tetrahydromethanopterin reductase-like flavin-dependent oxidoreductase (luciferase family) [Methylobacterium brachythecii]|uniref:Alkanesulfonate monooxygenase SsuD/methylene tetrahydromethanopterin reductase-like flavin-dependent oxidoreductase (Luciferase family) n=2 Tax=Methylobacterium brachythecii TaxID=1176177 RepID=A0A7W6F9G4_9HYPH|nr:alkanesulfonate monooxygenase SsuD/methylene tetrahydromethanopterin reductase-like flavin-dependent oxidoreductase (luciferase family) [Methylobacterium brachythecii]